VDLDQYRQASHDVWEAMAPGWEHRRDWIWEVSRAIGEWMVDRLDPQPGQTILELAAGPGDTGFAAAARVGDEGRLISTDFSAEMVATAQRRAAELGISNAELREMDAEHIDLPDACVDGALCRWGYMLMADPAAALSETRRVLRPEGRLACATWAGPERNAWASAPAMLLVERGHIPPPEPGQPGIFAIATPDRLGELLSGAGFSDVEVEEKELSWDFDGLDDYWEFLTGLAGVLAMVIRELPPDEQAAVRAGVEASLAPYESDGGYTIGGVSLTAAAS
jgi:ubiquinone/menaquinone biosynthesis C-methylase UbiE